MAQVGGIVASGACRLRTIPSRARTNPSRSASAIGERKCFSTPRRWTGAASRSRSRPAGVSSAPPRARPSGRRAEPRARRPRAGRPGARRRCATARRAPRAAHPQAPVIGDRQLDQRVVLGERDSALRGELGFQAPRHDGVRLQERDPRAQARVVGAGGPGHAGGVAGRRAGLRHRVSWSGSGSGNPDDSRSARG